MLIGMQTRKHFKASRIRRTLTFRPQTFKICHKNAEKNTCHMHNQAVQASGQYGGLFTKNV